MLFKLNMDENNKLLTIRNSVREDVTVIKSSRNSTARRGSTGLNLSLDAANPRLVLFQIVRSYIS